MPILLVNLPYLQRQLGITVASLGLDDGHKKQLTVAGFSYVRTVTHVRKDDVIELMYPDSWELVSTPAKDERLIIADATGVFRFAFDGNDVEFFTRYEPLQLNYSSWWTVFDYMECEKLDCCLSSREEVEIFLDAIFGDAWLDRSIEKQETKLIEYTPERYAYLENIKKSFTDMIIKVDTFLASLNNKEITLMLDTTKQKLLQ